MRVLYFWLLSQRNREKRDVERAAVCTITESEEVAESDKNKKSGRVLEGQAAQQGDGDTVVWGESLARQGGEGEEWNTMKTGLYWP